MRHVDTEYFFAVVHEPGILVTGAANFQFQFVEDALDIMFGHLHWMTPFR